MRPRAKPGKLRARSKRGTADPSRPLFPACDGEPWRNGDRSGPGGKVKREFLEAYFRINLAYANLLAMRRKGRSAAPPSSERRLLLRIEAALVARDRLEDKHAARGLIATPVYRDGFTIDLKFTDANTARAPGGAIITSSASVRIHLPLPPEVRAKLCKN